MKLFHRKIKNADDDDDDSLFKHAHFCVVTFTHMISVFKTLQ